MTALIIREAVPADRAAIRAVEEQAFGQASEADLVERLVADGDAVLELVAEIDGRVVGHVLFSRLQVEREGFAFAAVALAPLAVEPSWQGQGIGSALVKEGHRLLAAAGEKLSVVLGDPGYYARLGYRRDLAEGFSSDYQGEALQALAWGEAPRTGRLVYAPAFTAL